MRLLFLIFAGLILNGCQAKDNKLAPPNNNKGTNLDSLGLPQNNLRIGSYGLPIVALQQIEQIGSMIQTCQTAGSGDCRIKMNDKSVGPQLIDQRWILKYKSSVETKNIQEVQEIYGELESGQVFGKFKNEILQTDFISAQFDLKKNEDQSFNLEVMQNLKISNSVASEILLLKTTTKLLIEDSVWTLKDLNSNLYSLKQNKTIYSAADQVIMSWKNSTCAEFAGLFGVQDGQNKAQITVDALNAILTSQSKTKWSQKLVGCDARDHSHQNYDFLFY